MVSLHVDSVASVIRDEIERHVCATFASMSEDQLEETLLRLEEQPSKVTESLEPKAQPALNPATSRVPGSDDGLADGHPGCTALALCHAVA